MAVPLYQQIYENIQAAIDNGELCEGQMLPTEKELIDKYSVSRITIRRAIENLCVNGYLVKHQGRGTFVASQHMNHTFLQSNIVKPFSTLCADVNADPGAHVVSRQIVPARENERVFLQLPKDALLLHIKRIRTANGTPIFEENLFFPYEKFKDLFSADLEDKSLFMTLKSLYGVYPKNTYECAIKAVNADVEQSHNLKINLRAALLYLHILFLDQKQNPLSIGKQYYVGSRYQFVL